MNKRVSSRAVIFDNDDLLVFFRRRINENGEVSEYYSLPGGGLEEGETLEENVIREIKEEFCVDIKVNGFIGTRETEKTFEYYFGCEIIKGTPILGGEELERNSESNYYEVSRININDLDKSNIAGKDLIIKGYNKEYKEN